MRCGVLLSVVCLQLGWSLGVPVGVGVYSYQDSDGHRYSGSYNLNDALNFGKNKQGSPPRPNFGGWNNFGPFVPNFQPFDDFFPEYFSNLENLLQETTEAYDFDFEPLMPIPPLLPLPPIRPIRPIRPFRPIRPLLPLPPLPPLQFDDIVFQPRRSAPLDQRQAQFDSDSRAFNKNLENQKLAFNAAKKAYDLTSNQAGYIPHSPGRFDQFGDFPFMSGVGMNSAYAASAAGPGYSHQIAALSPENPAMRNVNVMNRFADTGNARNGDGYYSVSSSSFASSSDLNGKKSGHRGAETIVNNNGEVTHYRVVE